MSTTTILCAQGTGRFPLHWLTSLQAWPRTEVDAQLIARSLSLQDPRITHRILLVSAAPPEAIARAKNADGGGRRTDWFCWVAAPHDIRPEAPSRPMFRGRYGADGP